MIKILLGGSPCTHWSIANSKGREVTDSGLGWELFKNYIYAKNRFKPDFFLYENNGQASSVIKERISSLLGADLVHINSNLLSAQNRDRFYCFNWTVKSPIDKKLILKDIILPPEEVEEKYWYKDKSFTFLDTDKPVCATLDIKGMDNIKRIYNIEFKSPTLTCDGKGGHRVKKILQEGVPRKLTPVEYERLQTLPDGYTAGISDSQRYNVIGNGWTADIIIHILREGLKNVPKNEEIVVLSMYDGISVGRYCLEKLGYKNIKYYSFEIDKYAMEVSQNNYPDIIQCGDAFQIRDNDFNICKVLDKIE